MVKATRQIPGKYYKQNKRRIQRSKVGRPKPNLTIVCYSETRGLLEVGAFFLQPFMKLSSENIAKLPPFLHLLTSKYCGFGVRAFHFLACEHVL